MSPDRSTPPPISDFGHLTLPEPRIMTLPNGIKFYIINSGTVPVNNILVSWNRGEADVDSPTALRLMANCMSEGTTNHTGAEIADIFESNGSWIRFGTTLHETYISVFSLNSNVDEILPTLIEIITEPTFDNEMFEIKKNKHITDLKIKLEKVLYQASLGIIALNYGSDHPFSREETPEEISFLTRENIIRLYRSVIAKYPPIVFLSGLIDNDLANRVIDAFSKLTFESRVEPYRFVPRQPAPDGSSVSFTMPGKKQSGIKIAIPAINAEHPDFLLLNIAVTALGGYFGSRLVMNIRENKGYTYGISARLISFKEGGTVSITCECDNRYVNAVIDEIKKELVRLASELMDTEELQTVTRYIKSSLAASLDNAFSISEYHKGLIRSGKGSAEFYRMQDLLSSVTPDDIRAVISRWLEPSKLLISVTGDNVKI